MKNHLIMTFSLLGLLFSVNLSAADDDEAKGRECRQDEECPPKEEMQEVDEKENGLDHLQNLVVADQDDNDDDCIGDDCPKKEKEMKESTENRAFANDQECDGGDKDCPRSETEEK